MPVTMTTLVLRQLDLTPRRTWLGDGRTGEGRRQEAEVEAAQTSASSSNAAATATAAPVADPFPDPVAAGADGDLGPVPPWEKDEVEENVDWRILYKSVAEQYALRKQAVQMHAFNCEVWEAYMRGLWLRPDETLGEGELESLMEMTAYSIPGTEISKAGKGWYQRSGMTFIWPLIQVPLGFFDEWFPPNDVVE